MLEWDDVAYSLFNEDDGQLHEISVFDASLADWNAVLDLIRSSNWWHHYVEDGEEFPLPDSATDALPRSPRGDLSCANLPCALAPSRGLQSPSLPRPQEARRRARRQTSRSTRRFRCFRKPASSTV